MPAAHQPSPSADLAEPAKPAEPADTAGPARPARAHPGGPGAHPPRPGGLPEPPIHSGDPRQLGRSLRIWRSLRRIKQQHAAALLGISQPTLSRWESGRSAPDADEAARLRTLLAARLDSAADHTLARLVRQSRQPTHLVCDLTHRLLAASPGREAQFHVPAAQLMGTPLWRYASDEIRAAEARLAEAGWYEPAAPLVEFHTGGRVSDALTILPCRMRWVRLQLSDGSFARLVETLDETALPAPG